MKEQIENLEKDFPNLYKVIYNQGRADADQEHKAELEIIKGEIENQLHLARYGNLDERDPCYEKAFENSLTILDSHINQLSTE